MKAGNRKMLTVTTESAQETRALGRLIAETGLQTSDVIALCGPLGSGKTMLVKGLAEGLGVGKEIPVTSPTFVLLHKYIGRVPLYHFDAYRLRCAREMFDIGCEEIFYGQGVSVVEWADHVPECLPEEHLTIRIEITGPSTRRFLITSEGERWKTFLATLRKRLRLET